MQAALPLRTIAPEPRRRTTPTLPRAEQGDADRALLELGRALAQRGYHFTCVTPDTHALVNQRAASRREANLRDVFGWSRPFDDGVLPADIAALLERAQALLRTDDGHRSAVRWASLDGHLHLHSAWPTTQNDAVFFGPDTYRFAALIERALGAWARAHAPRTIVDVGCGSGAGGLLAARRIGGAARLLLADVNEQALRYAAINARLAGAANVQCLMSDVLSAVPGPVDLVLANPPYLCDAHERAYRHGGGALGAALSLRIVDESLPKLAPGGRLVLYTASAIVDGADTLWRELAPRLAGRRHEYFEIDPDVFGAELAEPAYTNLAAPRRSRALAVYGLRLHVLSEGHRFDLAERTPLPAERAAA